MNFVYSKSSKAWNQHYWIGLNDRRNESQFVWSDGTPYNRSVYSNWYPGEPNDRAGEDCVELYGSRWNDDNCKKEYSYICERPKGMCLSFKYFKLILQFYTSTSIQEGRYITGFLVHCLTNLVTNLGVVLQKSERKKKNACIKPDRVLPSLCGILITNLRGHLKLLEHFCATKFVSKNSPPPPCLVYR